MNKYIILNVKTNAIESFPSFIDAEKDLILNKPDRADWVIGKITHQIVEERGIKECVPIDYYDRISSYIPREGDVLRKVKMARNKSALTKEVEFTRKLVKVNATTVVIQNSDSEDLQVMPIYQWNRWAKTAELIKSAGEDV